MLPMSNKPGKLYGTAKTHRFHNSSGIAVDNPNFCPIMDQS